MHRLGHPSLRPLGLGGQPGLGGLDVGIYHRIMATRPQNLIKFHPLWESSGAVAVDYSWRKNNGTHVGVTLGEPGPGDGRFSPFYDGLLDYTGIYSAGFAADFIGAEFTVMIWAKVSAAGVWTDATSRFTFGLRVDGNNRTYVARDVANNQITLGCVAGAVNEGRVVGSLSTTDWMCCAITRSVAAGQTKHYIDGIQQGATVTVLGVWAGALSATRCNVGSDSTVPTVLWSGWLDAFACWNVALTPAEIAFNARRM